MNINVRKEIINRKEWHDKLSGSAANCINMLIYANYDFIYQLSLSIIIIIMIIIYLRGSPALRRVAYCCLQSFMVTRKLKQILDSPTNR